MERRIDAVIFDWGGVLIDNPAPLLLEGFAAALGVARERLAPVLARHGQAFQRGGCAEDRFWAQVCAELGVGGPAEPSLWGRVFREAYRPRAGMWLLAGALRNAGVKTALLSNTEPPGVEYFHQRHQSPFDVLVFSCREGCCKPEPRIYGIALERLGTAAQRTLFIDDNPQYVQGARQCGLEAVVFTDEPALRAALAAMNALPAEARCG